MGKKSRSAAKKQRPFVSVCTPTFNRRPFIPITFEIFKNQDYPKDRLEWIIIDDGTDPVTDLVQASGIPQIKYHRVKEKMSLGKKRNYMHSLISPKSEYIIYFDDDDWYPHDRISHSIDMLEKNPTCLIAGSSELYCYFKALTPTDSAKLFQFGPYNPNHSTAGTFCFHRKLLNITRYDDAKELAEERDFLKDYTIPLCQLDPLKTILVFSHSHNTFDKRNLLKYGPSPVLKESEKSVDLFFRANNPTDQRIKRFFMEEIDGLLAKYDFGEPKHKPNVVKQIEELRVKREEEMNKMNMAQQQAQGGGGQQLMIHKEGEPPRALTVEEIQHILQSQQGQIDYLNRYIQDLEKQMDVLYSKVLK
jgi:glycosyltransferase involved in cell wall biosynthesis